MGNAAPNGYLSPPATVPERASMTCFPRIRRRWRRRIAAFALVLACAAQPSLAAGELPALGAKIDETSVSGISSGAYMAGQFQIAHSKIVAGAAIIAGGPYGCAESLYASFFPGANALRAVNNCMNDAMLVLGDPNPRALVRQAKRLARNEHIDPIDGVMADRVYLFAGKEDRTVKPSVVASAVDFYEALGLPKEHIRFVTDYKAGHAFVTQANGGACALSAKPFVVDCDYDQAGDLLAHILGPLKPPAEAPSGDYTVFDQRPFAKGLSSPGLSGEGAVYVPPACRAESGCRIHVAFHGCGQDRGEIGEAFVEETGFARWADTNRLIVLFPQVSKGPANPQGCWDWWGYTGSAYLTREAPQIEAVHRMIQRLAEGAAAR